MLNYSVAELRFKKNRKQRIVSIVSIVFKKTANKELSLLSLLSFKNRKQRIVPIVSIVFKKAANKELSLLSLKNR